jgi:thioredoxin 1
MGTIPDFFQKEVLDKSHEKPVVVDFWAEWCAPCRVLTPVLEKLARESKGGWRLVKINAERQPALSQQYGIRGIPAVKLFLDGSVAAEFTGALPEPAVRQWLSTHVRTRA